MNGFYQHMKLKAHFKDNTEIKEQTEDFKKPTIESGLQINFIKRSKHS